MKSGCFFESGDDGLRYFVYGLIPAAPISTPPQLEGPSIMLSIKELSNWSQSQRRKSIFFVAVIKTITDRYIFVSKDITDVFEITAPNMERFQQRSNV